MMSGYAPGDPAWGLRDALLYPQAWRRATGSGGRLSAGRSLGRLNYPPPLTTATPRICAWLIAISASGLASSMGRLYSWRPE